MRRQTRGMWPTINLATLFLVLFALELSHFDLIEALRSSNSNNVNEYNYGEEQGDGQEEDDEDDNLTVGSKIFGSLQERLPKDLDKKGNPIIHLFLGRYYEVLYSKINSRLVDNVAADASAQENMEFAIEMIRAQEKRTFPDYPLIAALKQFTALARIDNEEEELCNRESYAILRKNDLATGGKTHVCELASPKRIESVIHQYAVKHAEICRDEYLAIFKEKQALMNTTQLERVEDILEESIDDVLNPDNKMAVFDARKSEALRILRETSSCLNENTAQIVLDLMRDYTESTGYEKYLRKVLDEKKGLWYVAEAEVRDLLDAYIIEPCHYYIDELGYDVFLPFYYDQAVLKQEDRFKVYDNDLNGFFVGLIRFRLCQILIEDDREILFNQVVKLIQDEDPRPSES